MAAFSSSSSGAAASSAGGALNSWQHDVFLSFRGKDTRTNFTSHLHRAFRDKGVNAFIDDELERGEEITPQLLHVIEESRISLVVFSPDYASSSYCLDELVKILECRRSKKQIVFPIFYHVDPTDVEEQTGSFGEAFARHEEEAGLLGNMEKVYKWRAALAKASNLSGWHLDNYRDEAAFVEVIVGRVLTKLNRTYLYVADHPVGLDFHIQEIRSMLSLGSNDVRMVGIWGIGGVGKSTVAKAVYNVIAGQFEGSCFLANVRETSMRRGIDVLQEALLFEILGDRQILMGNFDRGINMIRNRLCNRRVLIVIDDVDHVEQLKKLAGHRDWFGMGSRIIITTRDQHLLALHEAESIHKLEALCPHDALQLFSWNAFKEPQPLEEYVELSGLVVNYAKCLPLALVVLGSHLHGRGIAEWRSELDKFKRGLHKDIHNILRIGFDALQDNEKQIFLDIACFFKGMEKDYVMKVLDACDFDPVIGIQVLIERSLVSMQGNCLQMHDLLQSMGREIVHQESPNMCERSRLYIVDDILHVLSENMGTSKIEAIALRLFEEEEVHLSADAFIKMKRLRMLIVHNAKLTEVPDYLPSELRWLEWPGCPLESMPARFNGSKLAVLKLPNSCIRQFGPSFKSYVRLTDLDFGGCEFLTKLPDFSTIPNLERLNLQDCTSLVEIHHSIGSLKKLVFLSLEFCSNLTSLPVSLNSRSLQSLLLTGCKKLEKIPDFVGGMTCLETLRLSQTAIRELPPSIEHLSGLKVLTLQLCKGLASLPLGIYKLGCLDMLLIDGSPQLCMFPKKMENIEQSGPSSMVSSVNPGCSPTHSFFHSILAPISPWLKEGLGFTNLKHLYLKNCHLSDITFLETPDCFSQLEFLDLSGNDFISIPTCIVGFTRLNTLILSRCMKLREIPELPRNVAKVSADNCASLERSCQTVGCGSFDFGFCTYDFSNCHNLAKNEDSLQKLMPNKDALYGLLQENRRFLTEVLFPGNESPEWFSYCTEGDSLNFEVPAHMYSTAGIIFLAILRLQNGVPASIFYEVSIDGITKWKNSRSLSSLEKDHIWYCYGGHLKHYIGISNASRQSMEVFFKIAGKPTGVMVKWCGAHLFCLQRHRKEGNQIEDAPASGNKTEPIFQCEEESMTGNETESTCGSEEGSISGDGTECMNAAKEGSISGDEPDGVSGHLTDLESADETGKELMLVNQTECLCSDDLVLSLHPPTKRRTTVESFEASENSELGQREPLRVSKSMEHPWKHWLSLNGGLMDQ